MARWLVNLEAVTKHHDGATDNYEHTPILVTLHIDADSPEEAERVALGCVTVEADVLAYPGDDEGWYGGI